MHETMHQVLVVRQKIRFARLQVVGAEQRVQGCVGGEGFRGFAQSIAVDTDVGVDKQHDFAGGGGGAAVASNGWSALSGQFDAAHSEIGRDLPRAIGGSVVN